MNRARTAGSRVLYRHRWVRVVMLVLAIPTALTLVLAIVLWQRFGTDRAVEYEAIEEHFKYGSTGGERASGLPYWIFQAMPQVCAKHLPGKGYASLGFIFEDGRDLPVGMSIRNYLGIDRTFLNCAVCHVSTVRTAPDAEPRIVLGMPANTFDLFGFQKFLFSCARDPKFSAEEVIPEIARLMDERGQSLGLLDRYVVYPVALWVMRDRLLMLGGRFGPLLRTPNGARDAPTRSIRTRSCSIFRSSNCPITRRTLRSIFRRSGCRSRARECSCTGTATTSCPRSATRTRPSVQERRRRRSTSLRSGASNSGC